MTIINDSQDLTQLVLKSVSKDILLSGKSGIEKESLRVHNKGISKSKHPKALGSSLCNKYVTTDFSEALIEFITPPYTQNQSAINFLENIHHFVSQKIEDDILWPSSMPPFFDSEKDIPIADYGTSNLALFKKAYRSGLSNRYGRGMQAIAGIHYNFSLSDEFWNNNEVVGMKKDIKATKGKFYFRALRNLQRMNWLILYLFGASPIASKNFFTKEEDFKNHLGDIYLPYATSIRMSDMGYQNIQQVNMNISINSIEQYINELRIATETNSDIFQRIFSNNDEKYPQINSNLLQIEDEYYSSVRPKSSDYSDKRLITKLIRHGVDYIELRTLDINPLSNIGLDIDTLKFLELFIMYCTFKDSPPISKCEMIECRKNDLLVAKYGRKKGLLLKNFGKDILLKKWANNILNEMIPLAEYLGGYDELLQKNFFKIKDSNLTLSGLLMRKYLDSNTSFYDFNFKNGESYKKDFLEKKQSTNHTNIFLDEAKDSIKRQNKIEKSDKESFEKFVDDYFS